MPRLEFDNLSLTRSFDLHWKMQDGFLAGHRVRVYSYPGQERLERLNDEGKDLGSSTGSERGRPGGFVTRWSMENRKLELEFSCIPATASHSDFQLSLLDERTIAIDHWPDVRMCIFATTRCTFTAVTSFIFSFSNPMKGPVACVIGSTSCEQPLILLDASQGGPPEALPLQKIPGASADLRPALQLIPSSSEVMVTLTLLQIFREHNRCQ